MVPGIRRYANAFLALLSIDVAVRAVPLLDGPVVPVAGVVLVVAGVVGAAVYGVFVAGVELHAQ